MKNKGKLVRGIGTNDAGYRVYKHETIGGIRKIVWRCPFYSSWINMIERCYSEKHKASYPTYAGCSIDADWCSFSAFRKWMESQEWQGMYLDKDILIPGNKLYGPETCVFVPCALNNFICESGASRGEWPLGVSWNINAGKFRTLCRNPFAGKVEHIGYFDSPEEAHGAWIRRKREHAFRYADMQTDQRIAQALRIRYAQQATQ